MANEIYRIGIVGGASLLGKELSEELQNSSLGVSDIVLLDDEESAGRLTTTGDEPALVQKLEDDSFAGMDFVFFAGDAESTRRHWQRAKTAGVSMVDLSYGLEKEPNVLIRSPLTDSTREGQTQQNVGPDLQTSAVVAAHPVAVMLASAVFHINAKLNVSQVAATVMEPASEHEQAAMDELHQQTVSLLSFATLPREQYDAQVSFNLLPALGPEAKISLAEIAERVRRHYEILTKGMTVPLSIQMLQVPVFHGYAASVLIDLEKPATKRDIEEALAGAIFEVAEEEAEPPGNISAAGQNKIIVKVGLDKRADEPKMRFWLWMVADNLKLTALNAISCALELRRLRPLGKVQ